MPLKMKIKILISLVFAFCLMTYNTFTQSFAIKASLPISLDYVLLTGYDLGFEAKIYEKWTGQVSLTSYKNGGGLYNKQLWALQIRRYFKTDWTNSAYGGFLVQDYFLNEVSPENQNPIKTIDKTEKNWGAGFILGMQHQISGRLGLDIHFGLLFQNGNVETAYTHNDSKLDYVKTENTLLKPRPFWGINLYIALGKMPESENEH
jgi:Protein of unknown function (DUF3575)